MPAGSSILGDRKREIGAANLERVRGYFVEHLCATNKECAEALSLSYDTVCDHAKRLRNEWLVPRARTREIIK